MMGLDFASEYARRSDDEIRLLIKDRHNLVDVARDALDAEVHKRRSNGFQQHLDEPEEPRLHVEEDDEDGNEIVVRSRELTFPKICPRCLAPADRFVRISCDGGSSWGLIPAFDYVLALWRYLFSRYPVPFCRSCAISVRVRRWMGRALVVMAIIGSIYMVENFHLSTLISLLILIGLFALAGVLWKLLGLSKRWPPSGIDILSAWSARDRRLQFAHPEYEKAFVALNSGAKRRS
jgi:hypothetical protein